MSHLSGGVIHLDEFDADGEDVGPDVVEVVTWDHELCGTKTFLTGFLILSGRRFDSPNLDEQQKILVVSSTRALDNLGCKPSIYPSKHDGGRGGAGKE